YPAATASTASSIPSGRPPRAAAVISGQAAQAPSTTTPAASGPVRLTPSVSGPAVDLSVEPTPHPPRTPHRVAPDL
ncbi:hypothetical protein G3I31_13565, partial [Streptomyces sp. SID9913]|nr:hypothetical protein [Streptomyces sp. SID9913]